MLFWIFSGTFIESSLDLWNELCGLVTYWLTYRQKVWGSELSFFNKVRIFFWTFIDMTLNSLIYSFDLLIVYKNRVVIVLAKRNCVLWYIGNMVNKEESILKHFNNKPFYFLYFKSCFFNRLKLRISQSHGRKHNSPDSSNKETRNY